MTAVKATRIAKDGASTPAQFPYGFLDESGAGTGPFDPTHALLDSTGALINPATKEGVAAVAAALTGLSTDASVQAVRALLAGTLTVGLPSGAATDATLQAVRTLLAATLTVGLPAGAATDATLIAIKSALLAQIDLANLIVQDANGAYYARRESLNEGTGAVTVSFTTLAGAAATPSGAITPVLASGGGNTRLVETALFDATASGAGYSAGDVIARVLVYDTAANSIVASYWHDMTTGTAIATAPAAGNLVEQARNLAAGASTSALQTTGNTSLASIDSKTPALASGRVPVDGSAVTQPVSATALPLPAGAMADATGQAILTALQAQRAESLWTDDSGVFSVRVDRNGTISWADLSGNAASAPGTGARPAAGTTTLLSRSSFQATAAATGYSVGDYLDHFVTTDPSSGSVLGNFWVNLSTGLKLATAPSAANISPISALPSGAATSALQITINSALTALDTDLKTHLPLDTNGNLKQVIYDSTGAAVTYGATTPIQGVAGGVAVPVSATALPLPAGAATAAKQPALGTAGTPSADVLSFQGVAGGVAVPMSRAPLTYSTVAGSPITLTSAWAKVVTTTASTKGLRIAPLVTAQTFDIEWVAVVAGAAAPTDAYGESIQGGEDFAVGLPIGDVYLKSASGQVAIVRTGA